MIKKDKNIISKFSIIWACIVFAILSYIFTQVLRENKEKPSEFKNLTEIKVNFLKKLQKRWSLGDREGAIKSGDLSCPLIESDLLKVHPSFYNCNPLYLECFLQSEKYKHNFLKMNEYQVELVLDNQKIINYDRRQSPILKFKLNNEIEFSVKLKNTCRDTYLPQRKYSAGPKDVDLLWDNFYETVYIDKKYISNLDIYLWNGNKEEPLFGPSTNLSVLEREAYCQSQGKQVLQSRYLDAASYYVDTTDKNPDYIFKFPYPWTKKRSLDFGKKILSRECFNIFAKGCDKIRPLEYFEPIGTSWMGISYALGVYPEFVVNKFYPMANLKISSFYLDIESSWHKVGMRSSFVNKEINWVNEYNSTKERFIKIENPKVAFRCMSKL